MAIEIVSFSIKNGDFPSFLVCLHMFTRSGMWIFFIIPNFSGTSQFLDPQKKSPAFVPGGYHLQDLFGGLELCLEGAAGGNPLGQHHHVAGPCWVVYSLGTKGIKGNQEMWY